MPATVIAERVGWTRGITVLKDRVAELRPAYLPVDPASRRSYAAGGVAQCDFWFPEIELPVGFGQCRTAKQLPVLTMVTGYSRWLSAVLVPSRERRICSPGGGSSSARSAECPGCWSGTVRARSASIAAATAS
jgi:transposase